MLSSRYRLGNTVVVRTENIGTVRFVDPQHYWIEQQTQQGWIVLDPQNLRVPRLGGISLLGSARARCFAFRIPTNVMPGIYRVAKRAEYESPEAGERLTMTLTREFQALSPLRKR